MSTKHQFTTEQIEAVEAEMAEGVSPLSEGARLILEARTERDAADERNKTLQDALNHFGTVVSPRLIAERDAEKAATRNEHAKAEHYQQACEVAEAERDAALARVREQQEECNTMGDWIIEQDKRIAALEAEAEATWRIVESQRARIEDAATALVAADDRIAALEAELDKTQRAYCWAKNRSDDFEAENAELRGRLNIGGKGLWQASAGEEFPGKESLDKVTKRIATLEAANAELRIHNAIPCMCDNPRRIAENERLRGALEQDELRLGGNEPATEWHQGRLYTLTQLRAAMEGDYAGLFHDTRHKEGPGRAARSVKVPMESDDE